jgi:ribosomal protein L4
MVELQVYDADGKAKEKISFDESVFGDKVKTRTLREVVYAYEACRAVGACARKHTGSWPHARRLLVCDENCTS